MVLNCLPCLCLVTSLSFSCVHALPTTAYTVMLVAKGYRVRDLEELKNDMMSSHVFQ